MVRAKTVAWSAVAMVMMVAATGAQAPKPAVLVPASQRIDQAIAAMGGEAKLRSISTLTITSMGHNWALEQSERPEGPWLSTYEQRVEIRDLEHRRRSLQSQIRNWNAPNWSPLSTLVVSDDVAGRMFGTRWVPGSAADVRDVAYAFDLAPERLLLTAKAATDLAVLPDEIQQRTPQSVLRFTYDGQRMRVFLNAWTHLPTMLEIVRSDSSFPSWGDVTERRWYSYWTVETTGLLYPHQITTEWNGYPYSDYTVHALAINPSIDAGAFGVPDETKTAFAAATAAARTVAGPVAFDEKRAVDINSWIVQVAAGYNVALVKQPDGIVILESVGMPQYSASVLDYVKKRFPGVAVKALVTTSDAWPHFGGIREYVARGIPIYPLDLNVPILTRNVKAPFTLAPDSLAKSPRAAIFRPVAIRTVIGSGDTRIELIPVRGETGERMMLAWLPGAKLLYSSDLIQRAGPATARKFFMPMMLAEVQAVVRREKLDSVERVFGMHLTPTPWVEVNDAIAAADGNSSAAAEALPAAPTAAQLLHRAMSAMGGEPRLTSLKSLQLDSIGHNWAIEQSERPEGPWLSTYVQNVEIRDFEHERRRFETKRRNWSFPNWSAASITVLNGLVSARTDGATRWAPASATDAASVADIYALSPEKLLFTARAASNLRVLPDEIQQRVNQHVIAFTWKEQPMKLFLNAWTGLPTMLEITRNETRFASWGDVKERRWYTFWTLEKGGLMYPRQTSIEWNGFTFSDETVHGIKVDDVLDDAKLNIPEDTKTAFAAGAAKPPTPAPPQLLDESKAIAISDWVVELPSGYNVTLVKQPDGVLVFEATTSNAHAAAVLAFAAKRFPGSRIKAVITTSDAWPHIGGVREYVARGIPIYALDANMSILTRFIAAPHTLVPDVLSRAPKAPVFKAVSTPLTIGTGETRVQIVPVRGETGERMMIVWIPGVHMLYTSDLIQRSSRGNPTMPFFQPSMLMEVQDAVTREHITGIDKVFGMHLTPTAWSEVNEAVRLARGQ